MSPRAGACYGGPQPPRRPPPSASGSTSTVAWARRPAWREKGPIRDDRDRRHPGAAPRGRAPGRGDRRPHRGATDGHRARGPGDPGPRGPGDPGPRGGDCRRRARARARRRARRRARAAPAPAPAKPPKGEPGVKVRRAKGHYASDIEAGQDVAGLFLVQRKQLPIDRGGRPFLALTLIDRTGRLEGRLWDGAEQVAERFREGDHVRVKGTAVTFQGRLQVRLDDVDRIDTSDLEVPVAEFLPAGRGTAEHQLEEIVSLVDGMENRFLKQLLHAFLDDPEQMKKLKRAPAAQSVHHAWVGGLIEHTLSVMKLGQRLCEHYPHVDRDLVLTGCFLHDYGKIEELVYEGAFGYSRTGRLVGHLVMTSQWVHDHASEIDGFPDELLDQVVHIVVSHHGELEYGSPKRPKTLEALLVHYADVVDARMSSFTELLQDAGPDGWTDYSRIYDRPLYRGGMDPSATTRRSPRKRKRKKRKKSGDRAPERGAAAPGGAAATGGEAAGGGRGRSRTERPKGKGPRAERPGRPERSPRAGTGPKTERAPRKKEPAPKKKEPALTFNPFATLAGRDEGEVPEPPEAAKAAQTQAAPEAPQAPEPTESPKAPEAPSDAATEAPKDPGEGTPDAGE